MLYLWFRSDNSTAHEGFELTWNSVDPGKFISKLKFFELSTFNYFIFLNLIVCGGDITIASHGVIASPGSPGKRKN